MKTKMGLLLLTLLALIACGKSSKSSSTEVTDGAITEHGTSETHVFLQKYVGKFTEAQFQQSFNIGANASISYLEDGQVGGVAGSKVPYPTVCSFKRTGKITLVEKRSDSDRNRYLDFATHLITVSFTGITLTDDLEPSTTGNPDCQTFLEETNNQIKARGAIEYSYYSELLNDDSFRIQTSGGGDYVQGGPRTPSTLDEVYTRVSP